MTDLGSKLCCPIGASKLNLHPIHNHYDGAAVGPGRCLSRDKKKDDSMRAMQEALQSMRAMQEALQSPKDTKPALHFAYNCAFGRSCRHR
jgi:hypothetical protein